MTILEKKLCELIDDYMVNGLVIKIDAKDIGVDMRNDLIEKAIADGLKGIASALDNMNRPQTDRN